MELTRNNFSAIKPPAGPYVHAVKYNGTLYVSGLTAFGSQEQQADLSLQAQSVFKQLTAIAESAGTGLEQILKVTIFVTSFEEIESLRETLFSQYGENLPASSLVQVAGLFHPDLKIEIEATLAIPG